MYEECDMIVTKNGRKGTILLTLFNNGEKAYEVEFSDNAPETETIKEKDILKKIDKID